MEKPDDLYEAKLQKELAILAEQLPEYVRKPEQFEFLSEIGKGGFGKVHLAKFKETGELCAYKEIFEKRLEGRQFRHYIDEALTMSKCHNPFVLELFGFTIQPPYAIITPYMKGGSLSELFAKKKVKLSPTDKTIIAMGIAYGMHHVNGKNIYHRDLKSGNVLLDENKYPKICDFGIARLAIGDTNHLTGKIGTPISMAPELQTSSNYTAKVDVYAYSIILYELIHGVKPYKGMKIIEFQQKVLINGERAHIDKKTPKGLADLVQRCWAQNPDDRPTFGEIFKEFADGKAYFEGTDQNEIKKFIQYADKETKAIEKKLRAKLKAKLINEHKKKEENKNAPPDLVLRSFSQERIPSNESLQIPTPPQPMSPSFRSIGYSVFPMQQRALFGKTSNTKVVKQNSYLQNFHSSPLEGTPPEDPGLIPLTRFCSTDDILKQKVRESFQIPKTRRESHDESNESSEQSFSSHGSSHIKHSSKSKIKHHHMQQQQAQLNLHKSDSRSPSPKLSISNGVPFIPQSESTMPFQKFSTPMSPGDIKAPKSYYPGMVKKQTAENGSPSPPKRPFQSFMIYPPNSPRNQNIPKGTQLAPSLKPGHYISIKKLQSQPMLVKRVSTSAVNLHDRFQNAGIQEKPKNPHHQEQSSPNELSRSQPNPLYNDYPKPFIPDFQIDNPFGLPQSSTPPIGVQSPRPTQHSPFQQKQSVVVEAPTAKYPKKGPPFNVQSPPPPSLQSSIQTQLMSQPPKSSLLIEKPPHVEAPKSNPLPFQTVNNTSGKTSPKDDSTTSLKDDSSTLSEEVPSPLIHNPQPRLFPTPGKHNKFMLLGSKASSEIIFSYTNPMNDEKKPKQKITLQPPFVGFQNQQTHLTFGSLPSSILKPPSPTLAENKTFHISKRPYSIDEENHIYNELKTRIDESDYNISNIDNFFTYVTTTLTNKQGISIHAIERILHLVYDTIKGEDEFYPHLGKSGLFSLLLVSQNNAHFSQDDDKIDLDLITKLLALVFLNCPSSFEISGFSLVYHMMENAPKNMLILLSYSLKQGHFPNLFLNLIIDFGASFIDNEICADYTLRICKYLIIENARKEKERLEQQRNEQGEDSMLSLSHPEGRTKSANYLLSKRRETSIINHYKNQFKGIFLAYLRSSNLKVQELSVTGILELYKDSLHEIDSKFLIENVQKNPLLLSILLRCPVHCLASPKIVQTLVYMSEKEVKAFYALLVLARDNERSAEFVIKNTPWLDLAKINPSYAFKLLLVCFRFKHLRNLFLEVPEYFDLLSMLCFSKSTFIIVAIPSLIRRQTLIDANSLAKINKSCFLHNYLIVATKRRRSSSPSPRRASSPDSLHFQLLMPEPLTEKDIEERNHSSLVLVDYLARVGFLQEYVSYIKKITEIMHNPKLFPSALSVILLLSFFTQCAEEMKRLHLDDYFKELEKYPQYAASAKQILTNLSKSH